MITATESMQQKISVEDYQKKIERARGAVKPLIDAYTELFAVCIPKIVIHPTGRLEHCYDDGDEEIMAKYRKLIEGMFLTAMGDKSKPEGS